MPQYQMVLRWVLAAVNVCALAAMGIDKGLARAGAWRIRERTLFLWAIFGGGVGACAGMLLFRHKTRHPAFRFWFPVLAVVQLAGAAFCVYKSWL